MDWSKWTGVNYNRPTCWYKGDIWTRVNDEIW